MKIIVRKNYRELSQETALLVARQLLFKSNSALALPTGETPKGMYAQLVAMERQQLISLSNVVTFNIDEFYGLSTNHPCSFHYYMNKLFFEHTTIKSECIHIPDGLAPDPILECQQYEKRIRRVGGIDLAILGLGENGHLGFNEPGSPWESTTHWVSLSEETRRKLRHNFEAVGEVPVEAITMGIRTIMNAREILLLVSGREKARIVKEALEGPADFGVPASVLQLHPQVTVVMDCDAASLLDFGKKAAPNVANRA